MFDAFFKSFFFQFWVGVIFVIIVVKLINGDSTELIIGIIFVTGGILHSAITYKNKR